MTTSTGRAAILFDRDGTLVVDVPGLCDPRQVALMPGARRAARLARRAGVALGVVTNQPALGEGRLGRRALWSVHAEIERRVGRMDVWRVCPHPGGDGCRCRKPEPGLVHDALAQLGVAPARAVVIGDIGSDMAAARSAGAAGILVPTPVTRGEEVAAAENVEDGLVPAVRRALALLGRGA